MREDHQKRALIVSQSGPFFGPSDWSRTSGLVVPNHALYHLSYTRKYHMLN